MKRRGPVSRRSRNLNGVKMLHVLGASEYGGGSKVVLDLVTAAQNAGATVDVLSTDARMLRDVRSVGAGAVEEGFIPGRILPFRDIQGLFLLARYIRSRHYDVVHTHTSKAGVIGRIAAFLARTPFIIHTVHGFAFHERSARRVKYSVSLAERFASFFCHSVVTVSKYHLDVARRTHAVPARKLKAIPNGVRVEVPAAASNVQSVRRDLLQGGDALVVCHGRLAEQKGIRYLLDALTLMRDSENIGDGVRVCVVGDGPLRNELEDLANSSGLGGVVKFLGFRSDIDLVLDAADLVVLPSLWEGLSIAVLEALGRGCVVIASDIPSNRELIVHGKNGLLFPVASAQDLAAAMTWSLARLPELVGLGEVAKSRVASSFSVETMQSSYLESYKEGLYGSSIS